VVERAESSDASTRLRVAVVAPPFYEVPPLGYGGTELVCFLLVEGLVDRGHDVVLVAAGPNRTRARFVATFDEPQPEDATSAGEVEIVHAARTAAALEGLNVDVVHDHSRAGPLTARSRPAPTIATAHGAVSGPDSQAELYAALGRFASLVAISDAQRRGAPELPWIATVHNGIPVSEYPFRAEKEDYVLVLGRISAHKGIHLAIDAAATAGCPVVLAGNWTVPAERAYFDEHVRPRLGSGVEWRGEVGGAEKRELLAHASCLLFAAEWDEPFGLVLVEAMACGTPVVALRAGAVPELVFDGETGILCDGPAELAAGIEAARGLDPARCREHTRARFGVERMVAGYEAVYRHVLAV
jgi:glycosyltransferase involved in cell wall biosynthesis